MTRSAIVELAAATVAPLVCAATADGSIQVWDLSTQQKIGEIAARFFGGASNLAVHPGGGSIATGISNPSGRIAAYTVPGGELMWHKDRLRYPSGLRFDSSGEYLFCTLDNRRVDRIVARSGEITERIKNTVEYFEGPRGYTLRIPAADSSYLLRVDKHEILLPRLTFAVLCVSFGVNSFCIGEAGGPVRCLDYQTGAERWRYTPLAGSHALSLHYNNLDGFFYGEVWHYEKGHFRYLVRFDAETGQINLVRNLTSGGVFSEATQQLVTSSGEIIDLSSAEVVGELAFPRKEYPDRFELI